MRRIFLSPHLDDVVFSCGGLMWEQIQQGDMVEVWTFFTSDPPMDDLSPFAQILHTRWGELDNPSLIRRMEDQEALDGLGCKWLHMNYPDCIYRRKNSTGEPIIKMTEDLFSPTYEIEEALLNNITAKLRNRIPNDAEILIPLGVGGHIDHRITRLAAERTGLPMNYYADFPYAASEPDQINRYLPIDATAFQNNISAEGLVAWQNTIACYKSQINSFWTSIDEMRSAVADYAKQPFANTVWKIPH